MIASTEAGDVRVCTNDGTGAFTPGFYESLYGWRPRSVALADVDADGDLDMALAYATYNRMGIWRNQGDGTFTSTSTHDIEGTGWSVAAGDVDGDSDADFVFANPVYRQFGSVAVLRNAGGFFGNFEQHPTGPGAQSVVLADLDGDGDLDASAANGQGSFTWGGPDTISLIENRGDGTFEGNERVVYAASGTFGPGSIESGDFDADGDQDVAFFDYVFGNPRLRTFVNDGSAVLTPAVSVIAGTPSGNLIAADLDGDLDLDLAYSVFAGFLEARYRTWRNDGAGGFTGPFDFPAGTHPGGSALADVDQDGDLDAIVSNNVEPVGSAGAILILRNDGSGTLGAPESYAVATTPGTPIVADFDGDLDLDVAVANQQAHQITLLRNDGSGGFGAPTSISVGDIAFSLAAGDFDGDGDADLAVGHGIATTLDLRIYRNAGNATFPTSADVPGDGGISGLRVADLDGDGDLDILATHGSSRLTVHTNDGSGAFVPDDYTSGVGGGPELVDLDGDGWSDVVMSDTASLALLIAMHRPPCASFEPFCFGDGSGAPCPCGNASAPGAGQGCASSLGHGAALAGGGSASLSSDTFVLSGSGMPNSSALYFQGTARVAGSDGAVFGDGLRCAGGLVARLRTKSNAGGASQVPSGGDPPVSQIGGVAAPGVRTYQVWYRNSASFCTPSTFNLTNGLSVLWRP